MMMMMMMRVRAWRTVETRGGRGSENGVMDEYIRPQETAARTAVEKEWRAAGIGLLVEQAATSTQQRASRRVEK